MAALPSGVNCVAMDAAEHAVYAGSTDGTIFEIPLVGTAPPQHQGSIGTASGSIGVAASVAAMSSSSFGGASATSLGFLRLEGHSRAVNS